MSQPEASSNRPDSIFEALGKNINDAFATLFVRLHKASLGLMIFGNLIPLIFSMLAGEVVYMHKQIMFN
jgi:hypothetical protein